MKLRINHEIVYELSFVISDLSAENNLPSVLEKLGTGEQTKLGVVIDATESELVDLAHWITRDRNHKQEVVIAECRDDNDQASVQSVYNYIAKCNRLLAKLNNN